MCTPRRVLCVAAVVVLVMAATVPCAAQNASTGAITGIISDPSGAVIVEAQVTVTNQATGEVRKVTSRNDGIYLVPLLSPGSYRVEVSKQGFKTSSVLGIRVNVTETATVNVKMEIGAVSETVEVTGVQELLQTNSAERGRVTDSEMISALPLVTRNYTQIIALNPGISAEPTSATALGRGAGSDGAGSGGFSAHGAMTYDNNFQMNGVEINDTMGGQTLSGGVAVPNPDSLQEFKVLTGQYDASYGRNSGANVNVVTKGGSNHMHGSLFEYLRNDDLNANSWAFNKNGQPRAVLKQNQFGGSLGGAAIKDKLFYFGSYQGTRQRNGVSSSCSSTVYLPPLTNDRSAAALGKLFAGKQGYFQYVYGSILGFQVGPSIKADGSNINPVALAILQAKNPDGSYVIPSPQRITSAATNDPSVFDTLGQSSLSTPCPYTENQIVSRVDWVQSDKSTWSGSFFWSNSNTVQTFYQTLIPNFPSTLVSNYRNFSLQNTYLLKPSLVNQVTIGYTRQRAASVQTNPFTFADFGITAPPADNPPNIIFADTGVNIGGYGQQFPFAQNTYVAQDILNWTHGKHSFKFGGGISRIQINESGLKYSGINEYFTFADLMLGLNATQNGMAALGDPESNVLATVDLLGDLAKYYRIFDANLFVQDDIKVTSRLTLNVGFRYERLGAFGDPTGRNTGFNLALANPNPPASGTYAGFIVPNNFSGPIPTGVTKANNDLSIAGDGQNTWNPRLGFAWQPLRTSRLVLRGGWGMYHSRTTGIGLIQALTAPPLTLVRILQLSQNANATAANPFPADTPTLPYFPPITPTSAFAPQVLAQDYRPPMIQEYSFGAQFELAKDTVLDVSYMGSHSTTLIWQDFANQASLASAANPIRGVTTNTVANVPQRVPYQGLATGLSTMIYTNGGIMWYHSLQTSVTKRLSHGLTLLGSYTFARDLTTVPGSVSGTIGAQVAGDQNNPYQHYGPDPFVREHRFVLSYLYNLPGPKDTYSLLGRVLGGWSISGVTTAQSGHRITVATSSDSTNAYGIPLNRPDLVPGCNVNESGSVQSRLNSYFNTACFVKPAPLVPGISATGWGNSPVGIVHGPRYVNFDMAVNKRVGIKWPNETSYFEFSAQAFNLLNHPQFADPGNSYTSKGTFGIINSTIGNPRILQFALRFNF